MMESGAGTQIGLQLENRLWENQFAVFALRFYASKGARINLLFTSSPLQRLPQSAES
jgi:hypothetical protein